MKLIKTDFFQRAPKILKSAYNIALSTNHLDVVNNFSELKGIPQKIGQLISMDISHYFPDEIKDMYTPLQGKSEQVEHTVIWNEVCSQLDDQILKDVTLFEEQSLGCGSIGQVHKANFRGTEIVLKVQYPNIVETIKNDMLLIKPIVLLMKTLKPQSSEFAILIKEAEQMLLQETDYLLEKVRYNKFNEFLENDSRFIVPKVIEELSTDKIIGLEFIFGENLKDYIKSEINFDKKNKIAENLVELFVLEFFKFKNVQTDPNFANYLINKNDQIVLLDFGAVKEFKNDFIVVYYKLLKAAYLSNPAMVLKYGEQLGLVSNKESEEVKKIFTSFMITTLSLFHPEKNPVDFKNNEIAKELLRLGWELWRKQKISAPDSNMVFLHRKVGGLFSLLKEVDAKINLVNIWEMIESYGDNLVESEEKN
jgi:predicted unusual protein kinase regulating ubiquinone biosynthesis (AarF/ABC1/UbiB family)